MSTTIKFLWFILVISLAVGAAALSMWGVPAPMVEVRKTLSYDQLTSQPSALK